MVNHSEAAARLYKDEAFIAQAAIEKAHIFFEGCAGLARSLEKNGYLVDVKTLAKEIVELSPQAQGHGGLSEKDIASLADKLKLEHKGFTEAEIASLASQLKTLMDKPAEPVSEFQAIGNSLITELETGKVAVAPKAATKVKPSVETTPQPETSRWTKLAKRVGQFAEWFINTFNHLAIFVTAGSFTFGFTMAWLLTLK